MYLYDDTLAMKVFAKPSAERNSLLILASETSRACIEPSDNDSALLEAFDDAKCGGRRGWIGYEERRAGTERERDLPGRCSLALVGHFRRYWHASRIRTLFLYFPSAYTELTNSLDATDD